MKLNDFLNKKFITHKNEFKGNENSFVYFCFTDYNLEEKFLSYEKMKKYAKENYIKGWENDVHFAAFLYTTYCGCSECIDEIFLGNKKQVRKCIEFANNILNEYCNK